MTQAIPGLSPHLTKDEALEIVANIARGHIMDEVPAAKISTQLRACIFVLEYLETPDAAAARKRAAEFLASLTDDVPARDT